MGGELSLSGGKGGMEIQTQGPAGHLEAEVVNKTPVALSEQVGANYGATSGVLSGRKTHWASEANLEGGIEEEQQSREQKWAAISTSTTTS